MRPYWLHCLSQWTNSAASGLQLALTLLQSHSASCYNSLEAVALLYEGVGMDVGPLLGPGSVAVPQAVSRADADGASSIAKQAAAPRAVTYNSDVMAAAVQTILELAKRLL